MGHAHARSTTMKIATGFALGVAATMALLHTLIAALVAPPLRAMYAELRGELPAVTRLATGAGWGWGVPLAIAIAALAAGRGLAGRERTRLAACVTLAVLAAAACAFSYWACYLPLWGEAGSIRAD